MPNSEVSEGQKSNIKAFYLTRKNIRFEIILLTYFATCLIFW